MNKARAATAIEQAIETLTSEGYARGDVVAAIDSLIDSGIESWGSLTADEMSVVREQLES